jgi:hypothetical protein
MMAGLNVGDTVCEHYLLYLIPDNDNFLIPDIGISFMAN